MRSRTIAAAAGFVMFAATVTGCGSTSTSVEAAPESVESLDSQLDDWWALQMRDWAPEVIALTCDTVQGRSAEERAALAAENVLPDRLARLTREVSDDLGVDVPVDAVLLAQARAIDQICAS